MKHGSLFSGIGGFDLAAEWMGWDNVFHCEWNEFGQKVLNHYWPESISYGDITKTDFTIHRGGIDILTGGFPCQPFSMAGKRKGTEDDRHLWPEMLRAIREIQPRWVVGENVSGLINWDGGVVFEQVQVDLENEGYKVQAFILPACGVNAPHRRDRVWFVAKNTMHSGRLQRESNQEGTKIREQRNTCSGNTERVCESTDAGIASNTCTKQLQGCEFNGSIGSTGTTKTKGRQFSRPVRNQWEQFPTQSPVRCGNDGVSSRLAGITISKHINESIKAYGSAIVPQVVFQIFKAIKQFNNNQPFH